MHLIITSLKSVFVFVIHEQNNIEPTWEHERNCQGGRLVVSVYGKELAPYMWELLVHLLFNVLMISY